MATLRDVAREAGVSVSTASHALNGYPDIGDCTKARVSEVAKRLNYHANSAARALVSKRSGLIGVVLFGEGIAQPFFHQVVEGAIREIEGSGRNALTTVIQGSFIDSPFHVRAHERKLEGLVAMGISEGDERTRDIVGMGIPTVFVDALLEGRGMGHVSSDNYSGAYSACRHLLELGHRRIAYVNDAQTDAAIFMHRLTGYRRALGDWDKGLVHLEIPGTNTFECGVGAARSAADMGATAVMCFSDRVAMGVLSGLKDMGIECPRGMSVVGFDDVEPARYSIPGLTTVRQRAAEMGALAAQELILAVDGGKAREKDGMKNHVVPTELVIRASTGPAPESA